MNKHGDYSKDKNLSFRTYAGTFQTCKDLCHELDTTAQHVNILIINDKDRRVEQL